ncbi:DsbA family protein, partial [Thioclava sp. BHET1]
QVHDALMRFRGEMTEPAFRALADRMKLDTAKVMATMDGPEVAQAIQSNLALGQALQVNGTPTFVLGDHMLRGYVPGAQLAELVSAARIQ